jgi:aminoglycoside 6'-N-acetyltransferase I
VSHEASNDHAISIRQVRPADKQAWLRLRQALWPDASEAEHGAEVERFFRSASSDPQAVFVAADAHEGLVGFAEVSIRSYAEGCVTDRVGYLEGWFVTPGGRRRGTGRALVTAAERWARTQGCTEFASDTEVANEASALAHRAIGFADAGIVRCFRKDLLADLEAS